MLDCREFFSLLSAKGVNFFAGVPDSLLKDFCAYVTDNTPSDKHIIAANEGNAVALAAGRYLALGEIGMVYMQNSGLGNAVNPLASLADPKVYSIPMYLLIGWRGQPGVKDEPQHAKQGEITLDLLKTLGIAHALLPGSLEEAKEVVDKSMEYMQKSKAPFALVAEKNTFAPCALKTDRKTSYPFTREEAVKFILKKAQPEDVVVSTTGKTSRELFEYREEVGNSHEKDFLTVGSMGHSSQIAMGIALAKPEKTVICLDGDGALLMHMGGLAIIGEQAPANFKHIVLNNGCHDSVGGQPTACYMVDIPAIARACGYRWAAVAETEEEILTSMETFLSEKGPALLEIRVNKGSRKDLGRPTTTPIENKEAFMKFLSRSKN